ncbi:uncharacterized protein [Asterias amurensis]|uniref:uncharacterized protein n=1 Tax=Asterias amurensis TaxID=7602 RepID=UPI003AB8825D
MLLTRNIKMEFTASYRTEVLATSSPEQSTGYYVWWAVHIVFMATILCLGLLGNTSLCWIILTDQKLRSVPNELVLNLAVCGLFTVILNGPLIILTLSGDTYQDWPYGEALCQFNGFTTSVYGLASVLTLALISVNRYQMIRRSTSQFASWFTRSMGRFLIAGVWILSGVLAFPPVVGWSQYEYIPERAICTLKWSTEISYTVFVFTLGIFFPFVVTFVAYFSIFRLVRKKFKKMREHTSRGKQAGSHSRNVSNSSVGRSERRRGSQQVSGMYGGGDSISAVSGVVAPVVLDGEPIPSGLDIGVQMCIDTDGAVPAVETTEALTQKRMRSWSLIEHDIKEDSRYIQVANKTHQEPETQQKSLTLTVPPSPYHVDSSQTPFKKRESLPSRSKSAHSRIYRTASAPDHGEAALIKRQRSNTKTSRSGTEKSSNAKSTYLPPKDDLRVTLMVFMVLTSFVLCWSPVTIINFLESSREVDIDPALNVFSVYMIFASSAINPVIYGMMNRNFRSGFKRFFCGFWVICGACKRIPRQNRVSVINLNDETLH